MFYLQYETRNKRILYGQKKCFSSYPHPGVDSIENICKVMPKTNLINQVY